MDLEQILGRQRLKENPWKNYAKMFVKVTSLKHKTTKEEFDNRLEEKKKNSISLLSSYEKSNSTEQYYLAIKYQKDAKASHYKDDYVAVNKHAGKSLAPVFNNLMMVSEMRSFEVQQIDYKDRFSVFNAVNERGVEGIKKEVQEIAEEFNAMRNSVEKLKALVDLAESGKYEEKDFHDFLSLIPEKYRDYYIKMGSDRIRANSFQESRLKEEWIKQHREEEGIDSGLVNEILSFFKLCQRYTNPDIKAKLKELYQKHGYEKTAKASDLEEYFWLKKVYISSIKKNGFEIQKKR
jgi:hypothetical protein